MARTWNGDIANYASVGSAVVTAAPITFAAWVKTATDGVAKTVLSAKNTASGPTLNTFQLSISTSNTILALTGSGTAPSNSTHAGPILAGTWTHLAAVFASATSRIAYFNGSAAAENTTSRIPSGINDFHVGIKLDASVFSAPFNGDIGEVAVWSIALSGSEILSLAGGACPSDVQTANLVSHWHITGDDSPEIDSIGSNDLIITGSLPQAANPPVTCASGGSSLLAYGLLRIAGDYMGVPNGSR